MAFCPTLKNTPLTYMHEKSGFRDHVSNRIYTMFTNPPLTYKDKKQPFCRVITNFFVIAEKAPCLIATEKAKV